MAKIFIAEDDPIIAEGIKNYIEPFGNTVKIACDFKNIVTEFNEFAPHLVLLDISLPFYNGYHWCEEIRKTSAVPIIFISSASDNMNIIMAVNAGGDDFVAKPFNLDVLNAKITALLRRTYDLTVTSDILERGGALLNKADATLTFDGKSIELTKNEYRIMLTLMEKAGNIVSRETLMEKLWESDSFVDENTLTVNINRLRKKLCDIGLNDFISTKKGIGYIIK